MGFRETKNRLTEETKEAIRTGVIRILQNNHITESGKLDASLSLLKKSGVANLSRIANALHDSKYTKEGEGYSEFKEFAEKLHKSIEDVGIEDLVQNFEIINWKKIPYAGAVSKEIASEVFGYLKEHIKSDPVERRLKHALSLVNRHINNPDMISLDRTLAEVLRQLYEEELPKPH